VAFAALGASAEVPTTAMAASATVSLRIMGVTPFITDVVVDIR
jgi:hypothetical protein